MKKPSEEMVGLLRRAGDHSFELSKSWPKPSPSPCDRASSRVTS